MRKSRLEALTAEAFAPAGALSKVLPGYAHNKQQSDYAAKVASLVVTPAPVGDETGAIAMLEGETGIGKTLGYLVPLLLNVVLTGERAFISTHTNHLALQILQEDGPIATDVVARLLHQRTFRPIIGWRFGRRNFVDLDRVKSLERAASDENNIRLRDELRKWAEARPASFAEAEDIGLTMPDEVAEADMCLLASSSPDAAEAYESHIARSREADVMITNHALALLNAEHWTRLLDSEERQASVGIFDEADALPAAAQALAQPKTSLHVLGALIAEGGSGKSFVQAAADLERLYAAINRLEVDGPVIIDRTSRDRAAVLATRELATSLADFARKPSCRTRDEIAEAVQALKAWLAATEDGSWTVAVISRSPVRKLPSLITVLTSPGSVVGRLWRPFANREPYLRATLLTSATLARPSISRQKPADFGDVRRDLAIGGRDRHLMDLSGRFEVEKFGKMSFVLADRKAPCPTNVIENEATTNPAWLDYAAKGIIAAHERGGRVLVLTTSYEDAEALAKRIPRALHQSRGERIDTLLDEYRATAGSILITPNAWTGVNLPGLVDHLVIPRIPFEPPDLDKESVLLTALKRLALTDEGARWILASRRRGRTQRKLRQGIGRAIRSPIDQATLWILDPRFPIPDSMVRNRKLRLNQGHAEKHLDLLGCIPNRFRTGPSSDIDNAEIYRVNS